MYFCNGGLYCLTILVFLTLQYRIVVQCTLSFLGPKSSPYVLIRYRMFIIFWKKIHPVWLLNTVCLLNLDFFSIFVWTFPPKLPEFSSFCANFINFPHLDTETQKTPCLINFGYAGENYTVRTFISSCTFIKILVFFHPVCLFSTVCLLKLEASSTLYVYSIPYYYSIL